jgi:single-strand DNA-binding protein
VNVTQIVIAGNLVADADCHLLPDGRARTRLRLAASSRQFDATTGRWRDGDTTFLTVVAYRVLAEQAAGLSKGQRVLVFGQLRQHEYARDGQRDVGYEVIAQDIGLALSARAGRRPSTVVDALPQRS